jgi:hypothetical protein
MRRPGHSPARAAATRWPRITPPLKTDDYGFAARPDGVVFARAKRDGCHAVRLIALAPERQLRRNEVAAADSGDPVVEIAQFVANAASAGIGDAREPQKTLQSGGNTLHAVSYRASSFSAQWAERLISAPSRPITLLSKDPSRPPSCRPGPPVSSRLDVGSDQP